MKLFAAFLISFWAALLAAHYEPQPGPADPIVTPVLAQVPLVLDDAALLRQAAADVEHVAARIETERRQTILILLEHLRRQRDFLDAEIERLEDEGGPVDEDDNLPS